MYFGIFLNLYFFYITSKECQNNLLITFDEIELCLHPNWQTRFLIEIINFIKKHLDIDKNIQILTQRAKKFPTP